MLLNHLNTEQYTPLVRRVRAKQAPAEFGTQLLPVVTFTGAWEFDYLDEEAWTSAHNNLKGGLRLDYGGTLDVETGTSAQ